jgi:hypothetical protein
MLMPIDVTLIFSGADDGRADVFEEVRETLLPEKLLTERL